MNQTNRGRPANPNKQAEQRQKLIAAAAELLSSNSYRSITIRQLGERAGINSAMIRYYFESKEGLFVALLDDMSEQHFSEISKVLNSDNPIKTFIQSMLKILNQNSGLARMIHDEILQQDSSLKSAIIERFPKRMAKFLPMIIQKQIDAGKMRLDLEPKYAAFSLMGLIVLPYLAAPIREDAWRISAAELAQPQWAEHLYQLFMSGCSKENNRG